MPSVDKAKYPALHAVQVAFVVEPPIPPEYPGAQKLQTVEPDTLVAPFVQGTQARAAELALNVPAAHGEQLCEPAEAANVPAVQLVQLV